MLKDASHKDENDDGLKLLSSSLQNLSKKNEFSFYGDYISAMLARFPTKLAERCIEELNIFIQKLIIENNNKHL